MLKRRKLEIAILKISPRFIFRFIEFLRVFNKSYSEFGEDITLDFIIKKLKFEDFSYIDIGCHRPISGSNTYKFYKIGKRGTVIDANKHLKSSWRMIRKGDVFLNKACSTSKNKINFYIFDKLASSNSTSLEFVAKIQSKSEAKIENNHLVDTITLEELIRYHQSRFSGEYFLTIDIEGTDDEIIQDWDPRDGEKPFCIVIEDNYINGNLMNSPISKKLAQLNFLFVARGPLSSFWIDKNKINIEEWAYLNH